MSPPTIFISYSHDSEAHSEQVLRLAERLREDGLDAQLDQYVNGTPPEGWPRWMLDRLDEASFVLVVCTSTYYRRFRGHEVAGRGKGADWEGASITQELYDAKRRTLKFVPVMFAGASEDFVPEPLRAQTHYMLSDERAYQSLYAFLRGAAGVGARPVGELKPLARDTVEPLRFADAGDPSADPSGPGGSRRKSAWTARIAVAAVLVLGGAFLVRRVDWSRQTREEPARDSAPQVAAPDVSAQVKAARQALDSRDYEGAWHSAGEAVTRAPQSEQARDVQCATAMAWIRDMHVAPPMKYGDTVNLLLPCLAERAATTDGAAGADVIAHIGWAYFLKWLDGERQLDVDGSYQRALTLDSSNPFAHAMWGHWILWQHGSLAEARAHFAAALKSKREREFVRGRELAGLRVEERNPEHVVELVRVWNDMRKGNEPWSAEDRSDAVARTYWMYGDIVEERLDSILPAQDHLATFAWLNDPLSERNAATHAYWTARLTETAGDTAHALPLYLVALTTPSKFEREIRGGIARCQGSGDGAIRLLVQSLTDADATVRATAALSIAALPADASSVTAPLLAAVRDADPGVRTNAAHALGAIGADPSVAAPALAQALRDPVDAVRNAAAESLIALGEPAVPSLLGLLRDSDARVRRSATDVIAEIAPKSDVAVEALVALLRDLDAQTRAAAASALGAIGAEARAAVPALVEMLRGERDGDVRASVVIALGDVGPDASSAVPELRDELTRALADATDGGGYRGAVVAETLGDIGPSAEAAVDVLERALESDHIRVPNAAAEALGKIGAAAKRSIPALLELMASTDSEYRDNQAEPLAQIAVALARAGDAQAVDSLKRVLRALQTAEAKPERIADVESAIDALQPRAGQ